MSENKPKSSVIANREKVGLQLDFRDGKVYVVFYSGSNHMCGSVAVGDQNTISRSTFHTPEELLELFLEDGFIGPTP